VTTPQPRRSLKDEVEWRVIAALPEPDQKIARGLRKGIGIAAWWWRLDDGRQARAVGMAFDALRHTPVFVATSRTVLAEMMAETPLLIPALGRTNFYGSVLAAMLAEKGAVTNELQPKIGPLKRRRRAGARPGTNGL
jgi:hypothetical protein